MDVPESLSLADAHLIAHDAEDRLVQSVPKLTQAVVHAYPAGTPATA
ncbi:MAG: cation transporter dimerization domain-containing protein [Propionibacteriaceae bacterium]